MIQQTLLISLIVLQKNLLANPLYYMFVRIARTPMDQWCVFCQLLIIQSYLTMQGGPLTRCPDAIAYPSGDLRNHGTLNWRCAFQTYITSQTAHRWSWYCLPSYWTNAGATMAAPNQASWTMSLPPTPTWTVSLH